MYNIVVASVRQILVSFCLVFNSPAVRKNFMDKLQGYLSLFSVFCFCATIFGE